MSFDASVYVEHISQEIIYLIEIDSKDLMMSMNEREWELSRKVPI